MLGRSYVAVRDEFVDTTHKLFGDFCNQEVDTFSVIH